MTNDVPAAAQDEIPKEEWPQKGAKGAKKKESSGIPPSFEPFALLSVKITQICKNSFKPLVAAPLCQGLYASAFHSDHYEKTQRPGAAEPQSKRHLKTQRTQRRKGQKALAATFFNVENFAAQNPRRMR
jgi:hypothetical protein